MVLAGSPKISGTNAPKMEAEFVATTGKTLGRAAATREASVRQAATLVRSRTFAIGLQQPAIQQAPGGRSARAKQLRILNRRRGQKANPPTDALDDGTTKSEKLRYENKQDESLDLGQIHSSDLGVKQGRPVQPEHSRYFSKSNPAGTP